MDLRRKAQYKKYRKKKKMLPQKKHKIISAIWITAIFIAAFLIIYFALKFTNVKKEKYEEMAEPTLPTIMCEFEGGEINRLYGYSNEMEAKYMRDTIYCLQDTYSFDIKISTYGKSIYRILYQVLDIENNSLIQDAEAKNIEKDGDEIRATVTIDNMIEENKEYTLVIRLASLTDEYIYYYMRVLKDSTPDIDGHIAFVKWINESIYDGTRKNELSPYLDITTDGTGTWDFGTVELTSTIEHFTWENMNVEKTSDIEINLVDVDDDLAFFRVNYEVGYKLDTIVPQHFYVSEYYRTRISDGRTYLLSYERAVDEIFEPTAESVSATELHFGIQSSRAYNRRCSMNGKYNCVVINGSLWEINTETKQIISVFSFIRDISDIRQKYSEHSINILNVDDNGNIDFIVSGYMNSGLHEGESGVGLYIYDAARGRTGERLFIPSDVPFQVLKHTVGKLFYLNQDGIFYIMIDSDLYAVNPEANTSEHIAGNLYDGTFKISGDNKRIAWQTDGKVNDAAQIVCYDMDTGESYSVSAGKGKAIKVMGFLDKDMVYGEGNKNSILEHSDDTACLLMDKLIVVDENGRRSEETDGNGYVFYSSVQEYNRIVINRYLVSEGSYIDAEPFTVFATNLEEYPEMIFDTQFEETKKTTVLLYFSNRMPAAGALNVISRTPAYFSTEEVTGVKKMMSSNWKYATYGEGRLQGLFEGPADAVNLAYATTGVVLKENGAYFYRRGMRASYIEIQAATIQAAIEKFRKGEVTNITGITWDEALTFIGRRMPLFWELNGATYVTTGYTVSDQFILMNIDTGEVIYMAVEDFPDAFQKTGRLFVCD